MKSLFDIKMMTLTILLILNSIGYSLNEDNTPNYTYDNIKLDSLEQKILQFVDKKNFKEASYLMLEKGKLLFDYGLYMNATIVLDNALSMISKDKNFSDSQDLSDIYVDCLNYKGVSLSYMSNFDKALECYIAIEKYNNGKVDRYAAKAYNGMGIVFAMNNNNILAEEYYKRALKVGRRIPDYNLFSIYSNLGAIFWNKNELDSAMIYLLDAHKMAIKKGEPNEEVVSLQSLALANYKLNKYSLSLKYYNEACDIAIKEKNYRQLSLLKFNMINMYIALNNYTQALKTANEALDLAKQTNSRLLESMSLRELSKLHKRRGDLGKSLDLLEKSLAISDSIFNHDSEDKLLRQKADFELYRAQSEQTLVENKMALELANRKINIMIVWFLVIAMFVVLCVVIIVLRRQYKINKQLNSKIEDIQIDDEGRFNELREEIDIKSRELTSTSLLIIKFNELSSLLNSKLRILKVNLAKRSKDMEIVKEMETLISEFAPEKSWNDFKLHFEQISPEFYVKLDLLYPDLTLGEKRVCALISLNLTSKEIALLTGKSSGAINNVKFRIRKKMGVGPDADIATILFAIN